MQLSLHTDYALRTLMALVSADSRLSVDEVANRYRISRNHLAKVAQELQSAGYVATIRGRNGGMELAQAPASINVGAVVRRFENLDAFVACFPGGAGCQVAGACGLQPALSGALKAFLQHLDGFSLADLMSKPQRFARLLDA